MVMHKPGLAFKCWGCGEVLDGSLGSLLLIFLVDSSLFTKAEDLLDADVWLRVVESKFPLLTGDCPNDTKTRFAAQQLRGPAQTW
jgi:hypothetical protein